MKPTSTKTLTCIIFASAYAIAAMTALPSFINHDDAAGITLNSELVAQGIQAPTAMVFPGPNTGWITEQTGKIRLVRDGKLTATVVLDIKNKMVRVGSGYEEKGLLNVALHPQFNINGKFYLFYSRPSTNINPDSKSGRRFDHTDVVVEYKMLPQSDLADTASARLILAQDKPDGNHNGSGLVFGDDGYLYVSFGDGGGQRDEHGTIGNGQDMNTWLGKVLRIDINGEAPYAVPADNPYVGKAGIKPEIWAAGFRNPYRITMDKATKQLFVGEVGQDLYEEVDILEKGANYGWRVVEGNHCHNPNTGCSFTGYTAPISEYHHSEGVSVIGGNVYHGSQIPQLKGKYLFADWTGPIWYLQKDAKDWTRGKVTIKNFPRGAKITGWGEDHSGEMYILLNAEAGPGPYGATTGSVYKITKG